MGLVAYKGVLYGGGSDVVANPQDSATDTLTKVGIDGTVYSVEDADAIHTSDIGTANGVAELDANGLVPSSQLPSYVDDVLEYASVSAFPATGETGKIYVALDTNLTYRWSGSAYVEISPSLALGETSSTAYRGDRGKTAYDHATESGKISAAVSSGFYKFGATAQGHIASTTAVAKSDLTALGVADQNDVDAIEEDIEGFKTVTGKYITITDGAELPAKNYSITLSPVQEGSGDPSPTNVRPIHGADEVGVRVTGINQWDEIAEQGEISDSTGENIAASDRIRSKNYIPVLGGTDYYFKVPRGNGRLYYYDKSKNFISAAAWGVNVVRTTPQNCAYLRFMTNATYGNTYTNDISINYPSTDTTYHAFNGHSTTITLPSTVYGGSVEMGGSGSKTFGFVDLGTLNWGKYGDDKFYATISGLKTPITTGDRNKGMICDRYKPSLGLSVVEMDDNSYLKFNQTENFWIRDSNYTDATASDFKQAMSGVQFVYELATPTDITVTPFPQTLLDGVNNVWAECSEDGAVIGNAQQSISYQPQNIVGQLRQEIEAKPDSFAELSDTSFSNLSNGQIPKWNSTSGKWENANESGGGGASSLADLSDTNISSPADGQILKWDSTSSKWVNANEYSYTLPAADANTLGGIKVGSRLSIDANGVLSANDQSYTLPTASASTKGGIKVGDNLAMNGEVLSAKTVPWTLVWNKNSGETFTFPSDKTEILLVIRSVALLVSTLASAIYTVGSGQTSYMVAADGILNGSITLYFAVSTSGQPSIINNTGSTTTNFDFEVWAR